MTWSGFDGGDYVSHGFYLSSGKLLICIALVVLIAVVAFNEGKKMGKDDSDKEWQRKILEHGD